MGRFAEMHVVVAIVTMVIGNGERCLRYKYTSDFDAWMDIGKWS